MSDAEGTPLESLARALNGDPQHAFQVRHLALTLFDATLALHGMGEAERRILEAAALLHDIGLRHGAAEHHKRSRDMMLKLDIAGYSETDRAMAACVARYHRKAHPAPAHKVFCTLNPLQQGTVTLLAALLRVADGLDRSHESNVQALRVDIQEDAVRLGLEHARACELDLWGARRKSELFEEVFGRRLRIDAL